MMTGFNIVILLLVFSIVYTLQWYYAKSLSLRLAVITYLFLISSGIYFSFETYKGWPTNQRMTTGYMIMSLVVEPEGKGEGAIHVWILPDKKELNWKQKIITFLPIDNSTPRAYTIKYTKEGASEFNKANDAIKNGSIVRIDMNGAPNSNGGDVKNGKGDNKKLNMGEQENYDVPYLEIIPPDQLNRK